MSTTRPTIMAMGVKELAEKSYHIDTLFDLADEHNVDLKLRESIDISELTEDMIKVAIMVYYDWTIPSRFFEAVKHLIQQVHYFERFPDSKSNFIVKLLHSPKPVCQYFVDLLTKYDDLKDDYPDSEYWAVWKLSLYYGFYIAKPNITDPLAVTLLIHEVQRRKLIRFYILNKCNIKFEQIEKYINTLDENGNFINDVEDNNDKDDKKSDDKKEHPAIALLGGMENISSSKKSKKNNNNNGSFSIDDNDKNITKKLSLITEEDEDEDDDDDDGDQNDIFHRNSGRNSVTITPEKKKKLKVFVTEQIKKTHEYTTREVKKQLNTFKDEQASQLNEIKSLLNNVQQQIDHQHNKEEKQSELNTDNGFTPSFDFSTINNNKNNNDKNIITNKYDHVRINLKNDKRFDTFNYKYKKQQGKDPKDINDGIVSRFGTSSNSSSQPSSNNSKKPNNDDQQSSEFKIDQLLKPTTVLQGSGFGGNPGSSSSDSDKDKDNKIPTPEKDPSLRKYKKKDYTDTITYLRDQHAPTSDFSDLSDDEDERTVEYNKDGFLISYLFNLRFRDKYSIRFDKLLRKKYIEKLGLDSNNLVKEIMADPLLKSITKKIKIIYENDDKFQAQKIMNNIRNSISRNKNLKKLSDEYMGNFYKTMKSRLALLNKIINPQLLMVADALKREVNLSFLLIEKEKKQYKDSKIAFEKALEDHKKVRIKSKSEIAFMKIASDLMKNKLLTINRLISTTYYKLKMIVKLDTVLQALYIALLADVLTVQEETKKYLKKYCQTGNIVSLVQEPTKTALQAKTQESKDGKDDTTSNYTSNYKPTDEYAYMQTNSSVIYDPQLTRVQKKLWKPRFKNFNNNNNNNYTSNNNNNNYKQNNYNRNNYNNNNNNRFRNNNNYRNNNNNNRNRNGYRNNNNNNYRYNNNYQSNNNYSNNYQNNNNNNNRGKNSNYVPNFYFPNSNSSGNPNNPNNNNNQTSYGSTQPRIPVGYDTRNLPDRR